MKYILVHMILLKPFHNFNFQFKDEWDCLRKILFSPDIM